MNLYLRKDGRFESRIPNGKKPDGKRAFLYVLARTKEQCIERVQAIYQYENYEQKSYEIKKDISAVQAKIARRLSRKELLDAMMRELEYADLTLPQFDEKLWRIMVENVTVGLDGEMVFRFRNGMEVTVE